MWRGKAKKGSVDGDVSSRKKEYLIGREERVRVI